MNTTVWERKAPAASSIARSLTGTEHSVFWLDDSTATAVQHPPLTADSLADLVIVGAGYTGLWTAIHAKERDPGRSVIVLEAQTVGWAASGRNGGFVEASLTHGAENGRSRWPDEYDTLDAMGVANLDGFEAAVTKYQMACEFERTGMLSVAVEPHQVPWLRDGEPHDEFLDRDAVQARVNSPVFLAGSFSPPEHCALVHPARLVRELARVATDLGVQIHEHTAVHGFTRDGSKLEVRTDYATVRADRVVLGTNVFPAPLRRIRPMTVPVYDYVLMTEPLTPAQRESIGWQGREGIGDCANQFHYFRQTADHRILWGGYDAIYHAGGKIKPRYENRPETFTTLASHFLTAFPQLDGIRFTHKWAGVIDTSTQFCAFYGTALRGQLAYALGFTGLGVGATRFAADVALDLVDGNSTERTELAMVRKRPLPFPPEPAASVGINLTRWSLDRADHNDGKRNALLKTMDALGLGFDS